jgi:glycosyltransferase 2 family protein
MRIPTPIQTNPSEDNIQPEKEHSSTTTLRKTYTLLQKALKNTWFTFSLRLGCTLLLFFLLFKSVAKSVSLASLISKFQVIGGGMLLIGIIVGLSTVVISAYQWQCLLDGEGIHIDLRKLINFYLIGIAFNHFLPSGMGGDVVKAYYVGKEGNNILGSTSAVIMSRVTGFIGMLFVSIPTILIWHTLFASSLIAFFLLSCLAMCVALAGTMLLVILLPRLTGKWTKIGFVEKGLTSLLKVGQTIRTSCTRPRFICNAILFGMAFHLSAALNYYCYAEMLHLSVPITFYMLAIPFISLVAFLPISLNGYGLREGTLVAIFATLHASASTVLFTALLIDIQALLFGAIGGIIYIATGQRRIKTIPKNENTQPRENTQTSLRTQKLPI